MMTGRLTVGWLLAGWLVFGGVNRASGQVVLETALEDVFEDAKTADDRYGDYEPISRTSNDGPVLLSQIEDWVQPPGQHAAPPPHSGTLPSVPIPLTEPIAPTMPPALATPAPLSYEVPPPMPMFLPRRPCPPWRPCGPEESFGRNWFVKQGFAGADFRGACDFHDRCLLSGCTDRKTCDKLFLAYLDNACNCSAFPILCRVKARQFYLGVRLFGWLY